MKYSFKNASFNETGLSDQHHLIYSVMKTTFKCEGSKKFIYRNYSNFSQKDFQSDLLLNIGDGKSNYLEFEKNLWKHSVLIHQRHLRFLVTEIFKSISQINPEFMWSFFK